MEPSLYQSMPKIELHAHLNGSVSEKTLAKLSEMKTDDKKQNFKTFSVQHGTVRPLNEYFDMFKLVHKIVDDSVSLYTAVCDVIDEFAEDGVSYLELRSTPRRIEHTGVTKRSYMETVLKAIKDKSYDQYSYDKYQVGKYPIIVRYIAAIDRRDPVESAEETVDLAIEFKEKTGLVVGVDLSGDGTIGDARDLKPFLLKARSAGLKLAIHLAEVEGFATETSAMLDIHPDRVGHGTFIHPDYGGTKELFDKMLDSRIPLELCLTSNIKVQATPSYDTHHFKAWYGANHPVCICTDDKGVFATTLSTEYECVKKTFNLTDGQMFDLSFGAIDFIFESDDVKNVLKRYFLDWKNSFLCS